MDETYGTYVDDERLTYMNKMMILIMILMMMLTMMLMLILLMILMMILMMVGAGTCMLSKFLAAVPGSLLFGSWSLVLGLWSLVLGSWTLVFEFHRIP